MQIAPTQRKRLDFLRETLSGLQSSMGRQYREDFREMTQRLDGWAAKVAVIGQVKAGKSTFLNAFLQRTDFLPNDVNPWTSVVTNIHVNTKADKTTGARFDFFTDEDWEEIINGTNKTRRLAEQLLPGFDGELLRQQGAGMRDWAKARLGQHYHTLLGSNHEYDFVTPDLLKRYVCAGEEDDARSMDSTGRYSALTREANVWMNLPEFQVPAIITDTPGVNDPFLVRDEVTCRCLDKSDVFIVVLSAHQALTEVDIGLIRILVQQDCKDVLIFINRIDELDAYDRRYAPVVEDVLARLTEAIPDIHFDLQCGSALMADSVFRSDAEGAELRAALDTEELARFLQSRYGHVPDTQEDRLLLGSGMETIKHALSQIIDTGEGSRHLSHLQEDMRNKLMSVQYAMRQEHRSVRDVVTRLSDERPERVTEDLQQEIALISEVNNRVSDHLDSARVVIEDSLDGSWSQLEAKLNMIVQAFLNTKRTDLEEHALGADIRGKSLDGFDIDLTPLHRKLELTVRSEYNAARQGLDQVLHSTMDSCCEVVSKHLEEAFDPLSLDELPYDSFTSTLVMAKRKIKLELITERSWTFWKSNKIDTRKSVDAMTKLALAEMRPALEKLVGAFNEAQSERAAAGLERVAFLQKIMESSFAERSRRLRKDETILQDMAKNDMMRNQVVGRLHSQLEVLEQRMQQLAVTESTLSSAGMARAA